jgi:thioredoxin-like negative regulator of GroEL
MRPTIAQIDDAAPIYSHPRLTSAAPSQRSIVLGLNEKIERSLLKIFLTVVGLVLLLGAGGYFSLNAFRAWQVRQLLAEANALVNEGDYKHASLDAQRVLELSPENADAMRVIARSAESAGLRRAIEFWRRVTELSKNAEGDVAAWARCALRFDDADSASRALDTMSAPGKRTADYHALRSDAALIRHNLPEYEKELLEAKRIDPQNKKYELALATLHVAANDVATHEVGVRELLDLCGDESFRRDATHRLADDALRRNQITRALDYAQKLDRLPNRDFSDRLLLLSTLKAAGDGETQSLLEQLKKDASDDPIKAGALIGWMNWQKMSVEAAGWIKTLPPTMLVKRAVPVNVTDAFIATSDWEGMAKFCAGTKWETSDYMRNALAARALRELGQAQESSQQWNEAVAKMGARPEQIFGLAELARKWGWQNEALDLWWLAAKDPVNTEKTLRMLYDFYAARRDTRELYRVLAHLEKARPTDRAVRNNLAQISLLLNLNAEGAHRLAREVYEQEPKNADYAATYAFSLYLQGDVKKALQILTGFSEAELERPQIAAYYGVMLASSDDFSRAAKFLDLGEKADLLPEEKKLVEKAQLTVAQR